jgi:hypothetical protein
MSNPPSQPGATRRQFLRGAGGFTLGLPFLASVASRAEAQAGPPRVPRFVAITTDHGGVWPRFMFPAAATLTDRRMYRTHEIKRGALVGADQNGRTVLSNVLSAPNGALTPALVGKLNILQGLDYPWYIAHHTGGHLGNLARNDGNGNDGRAMQAHPTITIDQHMAWSRSFYPDLSGVRERSLVIGSRISWGWSSPSTGSGSIVELTPASSSLRLFDRIFVPPQDPRAGRVPVVDRVRESYLRLRNGNKRLSVADRQRLDDHMDRLAELERRLTVRVSCDFTRPALDTASVVRRTGYEFNPGHQSDAWGLWNDVVVAAFACGTSRIATMAITNTFSAYQGDWHQSIAHQANLADGAAQATLRDAHQRVFENVFVDLAAKLDAVTFADGSTLLDETLVSWSQESGNVTHDSYSMPVITAGSAAGALRTGQYVDYRASTSRLPTSADETPDTTRRYHGLLYQQYLATILDAMRIPRSEYEVNGQRGWGRVYVGETPRRNNVYTQQILDAVSESLPYLV